MISSALRVIVLVGLAVGPLAACTATPEASPEAEQNDASVLTSPALSANDADPCDLLAADVAEALAGEPMTDISQADVGGLPACHMSGDTRRIQVIQVPATAWAEAVPAMIDLLRSSGELGEENQARFDEIAERLADGQLDDLAACEIFSVMLEISGTAPGRLRTMSYVPDGRAPQAISAQSCIEGTYTSLMLSGPDIVASGDIEAAVAAALELMEAD
jgi:hypothetical protein